MLSEKELQTIIGLSEKEARNFIINNGMEVRVTNIDGEEQIRTLDLRSNRVNLEIQNNKVISFRVY